MTVDEAIEIYRGFFNNLPFPESNDYALNTLGSIVRHVSPREFESRLQAWSNVKPSKPYLGQLRAMFYEPVKDEKTCKDDCVEEERYKRCISADICSIPERYIERCATCKSRKSWNGNAWECWLCDKEGNPRNPFRRELEYMYGQREKPEGYTKKSFSELMTDTAIAEKHVDSDSESKAEENDSNVPEIPESLPDWITKDENVYDPEVDDGIPF